MTLVLDTHAAVWWTCLPQFLSPVASRALEEAEAIGIPVIAFWEMALLVRRGKLQLGMTVEEWARQVQAIPRCRSIPLTADVAILADSLQMHADPADRFIVATALALKAPLLTKDSLIQRAGLVSTLW